MKFTLNKDGMPEFYLWADEDGDARISYHSSIWSDDEGRVLNVEELGKIVLEYLVKERDK